MSRFEIVEEFITEQGGDIVEDVEVDASKPRVIVFYGALTTSRQEAINAIKGTKCFFEDMGIKNFNFYATHYTRKTLLGFLRYEKGNEAARDAIREEFQTAVVSLFDYLLSDLIQKNAQRLSYEEVERNFKNIVFRGHCMGSLMITNLGNLLCERMQQLGYSDEEIKSLTFNIRAIFSSSIVLPHEISANFDIYSYINLGDNELFKYAGYEWRANLLYMTGVKSVPLVPIFKLLQINNLKFVLLSALFTDEVKQNLEAELVKAKEAGDKDQIRKLEKVLLGHAWSLLVRPYDKNDGVVGAYQTFKDLVSASFN